MAHEFLEGSAVTALRFADQHRIVYAAFLTSHAAPRDGVQVLSEYVLTDNATADSLHPLACRFGAGPLANRKRYNPCIGRHVLSCPLPARCLCHTRACTGIDGLSVEPCAEIIGCRRDS